MFLEDALSLVAGEVCLRVHDVIMLGTRPVHISPGKIEPGAHTVWLVKGGKLFTLIKHDGRTLVFCHDNKTTYYGSPEISLDPACADGAAFLVQVIEDIPSDFTQPATPTVLVTDQVAPVEACPLKRREGLWRQTHVFPSICRVQWGGDRGALDILLRNGLPHEVSAVVALREPLRLIKEITIDIPRDAKRARPNEIAPDVPAPARLDTAAA